MRTSNSRTRLTRLSVVTLVGLPVVLTGACGESTTAPVPALITVEFEAAGTVQRDGEPVAGAHVALMRCDSPGEDGCADEKTMAMAVTGPDGAYSLSYLCVCDPREEMPQHSLLVEMPQIVGWQLFGDPKNQARKGEHRIEPECVEHMFVGHDFHLGS
jgi:hypothetical protein